MVVTWTATQARRQDLGAGGPKTRKGQNPEVGATFLK